MIRLLFLLLSTIFVSSACAEDLLQPFLVRYCADCHGAEKPAAGLNLTSSPQELRDADVLRRWTKVHDRLASGEMPPHDADQPTSDARATAVAAVAERLTAAEQATASSRLRRLTRIEYENTIRDLFDMPGIALAGGLPADGSAHGFDKHPDALDISHVNINKYLEAADHILDYAIATRPEPPTIHNRRISLVNRGGFVAHVVMNGDGVLLKNQRPDPEFPPAAEQNHLDQGAHERWGSFRNGATVGLFRHEDESFSPYFIEHVTIYPGRYRVRTSLWSFSWDQGKVLPGRGTEAARLSAVQLTGDGRGGQHPSYVLGYFDAPADTPLEHNLVVWLNHNEILGFNTASLAPAANYFKKRRAMEFTGPGIAVDWLEVEGPLYESWPPASHRLLFGDLPLREFKPADHPDVRPPRRGRPRQIGAGMNRPDPEPGIWTVQSDAPLKDAKRLLDAFLPKLFRRPVAPELRDQYVAIVQRRIEQGDCFELAMRTAYRSALVAPDFLFHISIGEAPEQPQAADVLEIDDYALACRLAYFLWNAAPDEQLVQHAAAGRLRDATILHREVERLLRDARSNRFIADFPGQWLRLREIGATDPDRKLYPEFSSYLQDSMLAETRAYFRQLLDDNLDASHLAKSPFVIVNQKLATHYGIDDVRGVAMRRVPLPDDCPRGGLLTQASVLKITANGTTTSPVPRGAFVMDRLLGQPPEPPPANTAAIEPDVRGATTIRDQLAKHRADPVCASCHRRIDPPGFALESFDVIGGYRDRYRSIGDGDPAPRGAIDTLIGIGFRLGPPVDPAGETADGQAFKSIREYQTLLARDTRTLLTNLASRFLVYATGREVRFGDRAAISAIVDRTMEQGGGVRTLLHETVGSPLFTGGGKPIARPANLAAVAPQRTIQQRMMMTSELADIASPALRPETPAAEVPPPAAIDDSHRIELQVTGLFMPECVAKLRETIQQLPEAKLLEVDFETARARIAYAAESELLRGAKPEQIIERLDNRVRQLSGHTLSLKQPGNLARDRQERIEIGIVGLDCMACSLAVHDMLIRIEGVEQVQASFRDGMAVSWIDPTKTNRAALEELLRMRGVQLREP